MGHFQPSPQPVKTHETYVLPSTTYFCELFLVIYPLSLKIGKVSSPTTGNIMEQYKNPSSNVNDKGVFMGNGGAAATSKAAVITNMTQITQSASKQLGKFVSMAYECTMESMAKSQRTLRAF